MRHLRTSIVGGFTLECDNQADHCTVWMQSQWQRTEMSDQTDLVTESNNLQHQLHCFLRHTKLYESFSIRVSWNKDTSTIRFGLWPAPRTTTQKAETRSKITSSMPICSSKKRFPVNILGYLSCSETSLSPSKSCPTQRLWTSSQWPQHLDKWRKRTPVRSLKPFHNLPNRLLMKGWTDVSTSVLKRKAKQMEVKYLVVTIGTKTQPHC